MRVIYTIIQIHFPFLKPPCGQGLSVGPVRAWLFSITRWTRRHKRHDSARIYMRWSQADWRAPILPGSNQKRSEQNRECGSCKSVAKIITPFNRTPTKSRVPTMMTVRIPKLRSISPFQTIWFSEFHEIFSSHKHHVFIENLEIESTEILNTQRQLQEYHSNKVRYWTRRDFSKCYVFVKGFQKK